VAKFLIEYELKANVSNFNKEAARAGKKGTDLINAIDRSLQGINALAKDRGLEEYFLKANGAAKKLKDQIIELDRLENLKKPRAGTVELARQSVGAGKLEYAAEVAKANKAISESLKPVQDQEATANLVRARYALYDIANEARRVGTAMTGLSVATIKVGADFQRSFADVQRTTGLIGPELEALRKSLVEISTSTSISFGDIAKLSTLAAQMGIEGENVAEFSEAVAKFSTVTGVTVENAAQSFGRIAQLLKVNSDEYDNLASSILFAGRNAVATEAEILMLTTQIGASAQKAGFLAQEAVGLATAMASLRIQPEQARGVILRLFADFDRAMAQNGKKLNDYAAILGKSAEETKALHQAGGPEFFVQLTKALGDAQAAGNDMNVVLRQIGITNTREVNVIQRLAGNHDLLVKSLKDATGAYEENTDLQNQFQQIMETLTEQVKRFQNNLQAIADTAANFGPGIEALTIALTLLNDALAFIAQNEALAAILALTAGVTAAAGVFLLYKSALLQATATTFAAKTAIAELGGVGGLASLSIRNLVGRMLDLVPASGAAHVSIRQITAAMAAGSVGARAFAFALKAIPFVAVTSLILIAIDQMMNFKDASTRAKEALQEFKDEITGSDIGSIDLFKSREGLELFLEQMFAFTPRLEKEIDGTKKALTDFQQAIVIFQSGVGKTKFDQSLLANFFKSEEQINRINELFKELVSAGNFVKAKELMEIVSNQAGEIGVSVSELNTLFPFFAESSIKVADGLQAIADTEAADELRDIAAAIKEDLTGALITPDKEMADFTVATKTFLQSLKDSKNGIDVFTDDGRKAFEGFEGIIDAIIKKSGTDLTQAITGSAAAIEMVEKAGGNASRQISGLTEMLNERFNIKLDPTAFTTLDQLRAAILQTAGISAEARAEISKLLSGGDFSTAFSSIFASLRRSISDTANAARREVRTIFDYVSQLRGLFNNITELAFASEVATDNSTGGWESVTRSVNSARKAIADLKKEISESATERISLESQLDIAKRYGDINEIRRITAEIESLDARIIESAEELEYQQGLSSLTLTGETRAARENRAEIRARVDETKALITAYAQTAKANGKLPTAAEVRAYARRVAGDFESQATAIGFSAEELSDYTTIIRGFGTAAANVTQPNINVSLNPITTAIDAYLAKQKNTNVSVKADTTEAEKKYTDLLRLYNNLLNRTQPPPRRIIIDPSDVKLYRRALEQGLISVRNFTRVVYGEQLPLHGSADTMERLLRADGGYISGPGTATSDSIPAMLSDGEYVIRASSVNKFGEGFLDSINAGEVPKFRVGGMVGRSSTEQDRLRQRFNLQGQQRKTPAIPSVPRQQPLSPGELAEKRRRDALYKKGGAQGFEAGFQGMMADFGKTGFAKALGTAYSGSRSFRSVLAALSVPGEAMGAVAKNAVDFAAKPNLKSLVKGHPLMAVIQGVGNAFSGVADPSKAKPSNFEQAAQTVIKNKMFGAGNAENDALARIIGGSLNIFGDPTTYLGIGAVRAGVGAASRASRGLTGTKIKSSEVSLPPDMWGSPGYANAFQIGKGKPVLFEGQNQNFSSASSQARIVKTTPEGLIQEALRGKRFPTPNNLRLQSLLHNFKNNKIGKKEDLFLQNMAGAVQGGTEEGLALQIQALKGNRAAQQIIEARRVQLVQNLLENKINNFKYYRQGLPAATNEIMDPRNIAALHSTRFPIVRDKNGNIILRPGGHYKQPNPEADKYARSTLHWSLEKPVEEAFSSGMSVGSWAPTNQIIVSSLDSLIKKNKLPYSINPTDTFFTQRPGQAMRVPATVITPLKPAAYEAELIRRGLIKKGQPIPPIAVDKANKEVLQLITANAGEAKEIREMAMSAARVQQGLAAKRIHRAEELSELARNWGDKFKIPFGGHDMTSPSTLEAVAGFSGKIGRDDSLSALLYAIRKGKLETFVDYKRPGLAEGGLVKPQYLAKGGLAKGTDTIPAMLTAGEYVMNAAAVDRYGVGFFDSLNKVRVGTSSPTPLKELKASRESTTVYLSEQDRLLLKKAIERPISLYTTDRKIAESANTGNKELARRGSK
jgi:TP901 family phage tail tape measure protein